MSARGYHGSRGVTLIELLVALVITVIVVGVIIQVFQSSLATKRKVDALARIQQSGRFAEALIDRDLQQADSFGCAQRAGFASIINAGGGGGPAVNFAGPAVMGAEDPGGSSVNDSDTITLRGAGPLNTRVTADATTNSPVTLASVAGLNAGDMVMLSRCLSPLAASAANPGTEFFQATAVNAGTGDVSHAASGTPGNATATLSQTYAGPNVQGIAQTVRQTAYRVATSGGEPTLQLSINGRAWQDLIGNVHTMQIVYGEDSDGDDVANHYLPADQVNMAEVIAVRIQLLIRGGVDNVASVGSTPNVNSSGNQEVTLGAAFGGTTITLPDGEIGQLFTLTSTLRSRLP